MPTTIEGFKALEQEYAKKVKELEVIEEKFNQCVAIIPESDEATIKLTGEVEKLKNDLDSTTK